MVWDARQAVWNQILPNGARGTPGSFGAVFVREEDFYTALGDVYDAML